MISLIIQIFWLNPCFFSTVYASFSIVPGAGRGSGSQRLLYTTLFFRASFHLQLLIHHSILNKGLVPSNFYWSSSPVVLHFIGSFSLSCCAFSIRGFCMRSGY